MTIERRKPIIPAAEFGQVFEKFSKTNVTGDNPIREEWTVRHAGLTLGPHMKVSVCGGWDSIPDEWKDSMDSFWVKPNAGIAQVLSDNIFMLDCDRLHFEAWIDFEGEEVRIWASYGNSHGAMPLCDVTLASWPQPGQEDSESDMETLAASVSKMTDAMEGPTGTKKASKGPSAPKTKLGKYVRAKKGARAIAKNERLSGRGNHVKIPDDVKEVLLQADAVGPTLTLKGQLDPKLYKRTDKIIKLLGGKWNRSKGCHIFKYDVKQLLKNALDAGEVENVKKTLQAFMTPDELADRMAGLLHAEPDHCILEPSAGEGALIKAVNRLAGACEFDAVELDPTRRAVLANTDGIRVIGDDFMEMEHNAGYDRIIMNPPFNKNQDVEHVSKAYTHLKPGGILVAVMSKSWLNGSQKKQVAFKEWFEGLGDQFSHKETVEAGTFKSSGTGIETVLVQAYQRSDYPLPPLFQD
jgi:predicted RNA methylase